MKVAIVGATGETGRSIVNGLLAADATFEITALVRPSSLEKPATSDLRARGVKVVPADLQGPHDELVGILQGMDVVISAIYYQSLSDEIPLANAAKAAGVQRYVPCFWATVAPRGVMQLRDEKEKILDHVQRLRLPYCVIDVGWWYQIGVPRIPSGRLDNGLVGPANTIFGDGNVPIALTDNRDIGLYAAKIISDPRTLNRKVFAFTEIMTQNQIFDLVEKVSGEKPDSTNLSADEVEAHVAQCRQAGGPINQTRALYEYYNSWGVRGDNSPEWAKYLGYLVLDELYPEFKGRSLENYVQELLDGKVAKAYSS